MANLIIRVKEIEFTWELKMFKRVLIFGTICIKTTLYNLIRIY